VIPKSSHKERMAENFDVFDFVLTDAELASIGTLDRGDAGRAGGHPLEVGNK
jgi:2,5-diketo-D-gluconate reductase A